MYVIEKNTWFKPKKPGLNQKNLVFWFFLKKPGFFPTLAFSDFRQESSFLTILMVEKRQGLFLISEKRQGAFLTSKKGQGTILTF